MEKQYVLNCLECLDEIADRLYQECIGSDDYEDLKDYIDIIRKQVEATADKEKPL